MDKEQKIARLKNEAKAEGVSLLLLWLIGFIMTLPAILIAARLAYVLIKMQILKDRDN